jgi:hypothetical protein
MSQELVYMQKGEDSLSLRKFWVWGDNSAREIHPTGLDTRMIEDFYALYLRLRAEGFVEKQVPLFAR